MYKLVISVCVDRDSPDIKAFQMSLLCMCGSTDYMLLDYIPRTMQGNLFCTDYSAANIPQVSKYWVEGTFGSPDKMGFHHCIYFWTLFYSLLLLFYLFNLLVGFMSTLKDKFDYEQYAYHFLVES